jgi:DNA invertase Pin-like site-specific DNA recombinase
VTGTVAVVVIVLVTAAAGGLSAATVPGRLRTRRRHRAEPVGRRPAKAELELATPAREDDAEETRARESRLPTRPALRAVSSGDRPSPILGYASWDGRNGVHASAFRAQAEEIASECNRLDLRLLELVREREPQRGRALDRPGLGYALRSIEQREAEGLVVAELSRLTHSAAELGRVLQWFLDRDARLIAIAQGLDTGRAGGRLAAEAIIEVSRWEHERLVERTRNGMLAARRKGPPGVADYPQLKERIAQMRADGMTLEAIAGQLNREGTPTIRGGAKWRPSSVQVAAGYRRPPAGHRNHSRRNGIAPQPSDGTT